MKHKKSHTIATLKEIYDYIFRRKGNGSRHKLERKMMQDSFVEEALEGFTLVDESRAKQDVARLNEQIHDSARKTPVYWYASIVATLALLIIAGVGLLLMEQSQQSMRESRLTINEPSEPEEKRTSADESALKAPEESAAKTTEPIKTPTKRQKEVSVNVPMDSAPSTSSPEDTEEILVADYEMSVPDGNETDTGIFTLSIPLDTTVIVEEKLQISSGTVIALTETPMIVLPDLDTLSPESTHLMLRGQVVDASDNTPLPGVAINVKDSRLATVTDTDGYFELEVPRDEETILVASYIGMVSLEIDAATLAQNDVLSLTSDMAILNEVYVIGYGTSAKRGYEKDLHTDDKMNRRDYSPPMPRDGYPAYRQYLRDNALLNESDDRNRAVVVIRFTVNHNGVPSNFKIIRSPGEMYSEKAVDLIKNGPDWQAAQLGSNYLEETVRFRIVFRKKTD